MTPFQDLITKEYSPIPIAMLLVMHRKFEYASKDNKRKTLRYFPFYRSNTSVYTHFVMISKV